MLIQVISFEIHNAKQGIHEKFLVENTFENQDKIFSHRFTRDIKFIKTFEFEFAKKEHMPLSFIEFDDEIDSVDEMVGTF